MDKVLERELKHDAEEAEHEKPIPGSKAILAVVLLAVLAGMVMVFGILSRIRAEKSLAAETDALSVSNVTVATPQLGAPEGEIVLPGNIYPYADAPIYSRTDGYLQKWYFDIGAHVNKGDLLAVISTPEIDQQLLQAKAELVTAKSNAKIASVTAQRYMELLPSAAVSKQDADIASSQSETTQASVQAADANVQRIEKLQSFERIYAPFDGVVTARNVDVGQLITSGSSGGATSQLFHIAAVNQLRIYVGVPQGYGDVTKPDVTAILTFDEYPGKSFPAEIVRTSHYVDPTSRTLLVELDYDNRKGVLTPGTYTQVHFHTRSNVPALTIPASALMFRSEGLHVATVVRDQSGRSVAKLIPIILGEDDGRVVQVAHGLDQKSLVVQNPPDSLIDGEPVNVVTKTSIPGLSARNRGKA